MRKIRDILISSAEQYPHNTAITKPGDSAIDYSGLLRLAKKYRTKLSAFGIEESDIVGILLEKDIPYVASIFAIGLLGGIYIPLDISAPSQRIHYILKDSHCSGVITTQDHANTIRKEWGQNATYHNLDGENMIFVKFILDKNTVKTDEDLAYILYTSGSTGDPKGVMITHENALSFIKWGAETFDTTDLDVFSSIAMFHFDLSVFDLFVGLLKGARVVLMDSKTIKNPLMMAYLFQTEGITISYATPTVYKLMMRYGKMDRYDHTSLHTVLYAGEVFPVEDLSRLQKIWPNTSIYNLYGPTETNVVTWHKIEDDTSKYKASSVPIGVSCSHVTCKVLSDHVIHLDHGVEGELVVNGASVCPGYMNDKKKTDAAFLEWEGTLWYKTGDLVELDSFGEFVFKGRKDHMVKRRGYRIELNEIMACINKHENIEEAAVIAPKEGGETKIKAYICVNQSGNPNEIQELKAFILKYLPLYMMPDEFVLIDSIPKTSTQKIDYKSLEKL